MRQGERLLDFEQILPRVGLAPGMNVADFGVGRGGHLVQAVSRALGPNGQVFAVDISRDNLRSVDLDCAARGLDNVRSIWGDFERARGVDIEPESLDLIFCVNNLWCLTNHAQMMAEARRLLHPTGQLVVIDWHHQLEHPLAPPLAQRLSLYDAMRLARTGGFVQTRDLYISGTHWGLLGVPNA